MGPDGEELAPEPKAECAPIWRGRLFAPLDVNAPLGSASRWGGIASDVAPHPGGGAAPAAPPVIGSRYQARRRTWPRQSTLKAGGCSQTSLAVSTVWTRSRSTGSGSTSSSSTHTGIRPNPPKRWLTHWCRTAWIGRRPRGSCSSTPTPSSSSNVRRRQRRSREPDTAAATGRAPAGSRPRGDDTDSERTRPPGLRKVYTLLGTDRRPYQSSTPGGLAGH